MVGAPMALLINLIHEGGRVCLAQRLGPSLPRPQRQPPSPFAHD